MLSYTATKDEAAAAFKIVEQECGASPELRDDFVRHATGQYWERTSSLEFRFQGKLGFGGKLRRSIFDGFYVDCYREDETPERRAMIDRANERLKEAFG